MTATHGAESKSNEWNAIVTRYKKELDDAQEAVNKQRQGIRWQEQALKQIMHGEMPRWLKEIRKDELETDIRAAEKELVGLEERAEAYSSRLKSANPSMQDKARN